MTNLVAQARAEADLLAHDGEPLLATLMRELADEIGRLQAGHAHYEFLRCCNPREFIEIWKANIKHGLLFDDIVDKMRLPGDPPATDSSPPLPP